MPPVPTARVLSFGAGADSFALLLFALETRTPLDLVIFADVTDPQRQDPGEWDATYAHLERVVLPLCAARGVPFKWLRTDESPIRGERSLYRWFLNLHAVPSTQYRMCTSAAKIERLEAYTDRLYPQGTIETWVGFDAAELSRLADDPHAAMPVGSRRRKRFPLIDLGLCRCRLEAYIRRLGYPVPPKSACVYCPAGSKGDFQRLEATRPDWFRAACRLEAGCQVTKAGKILRLAGNYDRGDGTDPTLAEWITKPYRHRLLACEVCGASERARKVVGAGDLLPSGAGPLALPAPASVVLSWDAAGTTQVAGSTRAYVAPEDLAPGAPALEAGPAETEGRNAVRYPTRRGRDRFAQLVPGTVASYADRPMLVEADGRLLPAHAVLSAPRELTLVVLATGERLVVDAEARAPLAPAELDPRAPVWAEGLARNGDIVLTYRTRAGSAGQARGRPELLREVQGEALIATSGPDASGRQPLVVVRVDRHG